MDGDSAVDTKPVIESTVEAVEEPKPVEASDPSEESVEQSTEPNKADSEPTAADKEVSDEKMDVESSAVETAATDEPKPADSEPAVEEPAVDEQIKGVEPSVEPVPEVAVKSPSDASVNLSSPSPAVQPSSTPPRSQSAKKPKVDLTTVPVRQYLDTTVVPILLQGLSSLARERPAKPIAYLANFLNEKASEYDE